MSQAIATRYALRSLLRHRRRTALSIIGIGVGGATCLFLIGFVRGEREMMMRAAAESGTGHVRIAPQDWARTRENNARLVAQADRLAALRTLQDVEAVAPHTRTEALLAMGTRTVGVLMVGVDPDVEPRLNRLVRTVSDGNYLVKGEPGNCVIGRGVATRLDADVGDDIMVTASGTDGDMRSAMLRIRGIVTTGSKELDAALCQVLIEDVGELSGAPGFGEISILLRDPTRLAEAMAELRPFLASGESLVPWMDIIPELASSVKIDETWTRMIVGVVMIVVFLGIASAQLAAVLERRREFAVLSAIGMKGGRLVGVMVAEGIFLGFVGAFLALAIGCPLSYWVSQHGIDFSAMYGDMDLGVSNILIDPVIYGEFGWWLVPLAFTMSLGATILSSLYPAWYAIRIQPADALKVDH